MNIGRASVASGVTTKMIRYYESKGLIYKVNRTDSNYRQYTQNDVQILRFIKRSRDLGFSLERIKMLLALWRDKSRESADVKVLARQYVMELERDILKLQTIRDQLDYLAQSCQGDHRAECPILDDLARVAH